MRLYYERYPAGCERLLPFSRLKPRPVKRPGLRRSRRMREFFREFPEGPYKAIPDFLRITDPTCLDSGAVERMSRTGGRGRPED